MCWERLSDELARDEARLTETVREEDLERPEFLREPTSTEEKAPEREKELARV